MRQRGKRKEIIGFVTSDKADKTITVEVSRLVKHPRYGKYIKKFTVLKAHDEKNDAGIGDKVRIVATRPLSKTKSWRLLEIIEKKAASVEI